MSCQPNDQTSSKKRGDNFKEVTTTKNKSVLDTCIPVLPLAGTTVHSVHSTLFFVVPNLPLLYSYFVLEKALHHSKLCYGEGVHSLHQKTLI